MIKIPESAREQDYSVCQCGKGVHLHQAGFEFDLHACPSCFQLVADKDEFFKFQTGWS